MYPTCKRRYPFRLGTTSYIYPADYATNIQKLAPMVDEIELLLLEGDHLPSRQEIADLKTLSHDLDIVYNVHLPMDVALADSAPKERLRSRDLLARTIERVNPLKATTHTLHLAYHETGRHPDTVLAWQERAIRSMGRLLDRLPIASRHISLETLDFQPRWIKPIVARYDLSVCLDVGHVVRYGYDLQQVVNDFDRCITIVHLHGVDGGRDHRSLARLDMDARRIIGRFLHHFRGSVSLEVFSQRRFTDSMACFDDLMDQGCKNGTPTL